MPRVQPIQEIDREGNVVRAWTDMLSAREDLGMHRKSIWYCTTKKPETQPRNLPEGHRLVKARVEEVTIE